MSEKRKEKKKITVLFLVSLSLGGAHQGPDIMNVPAIRHPIPGPQAKAEDDNIRERWEGHGTRVLPTTHHQLRSAAGQSSAPEDGAGTCTRT